MQGDFPILDFGLGPVIFGIQWMLVDVIQSWNKPFMFRPTREESASVGPLNQEDERSEEQT